MNLQPTLFDLKPINSPAYEKGATLRQRWWAYHTANLHIYNLLRDMALDLKAQGFQRCGISLLWERLRWEYYVTTKGESTYRFSNNYRAFYARFLMAREPELRNFFEVRKQPSQEE